MTVQVLDGTLSYIGVHAIGAAVEANPILAWYLAAFGPTAAFVGAKLFAVACGAILLVTGYYRWLASLTALYVICAIGPWLLVLGNHPAF